MANHPNRSKAGRYVVTVEAHYGEYGYTVRKADGALMHESSGLYPSPEQARAAGNECVKRRAFTSAQ